MDIDEFEDYLELQDPKVRAHIRTSTEEYLAGKSRPAGELLTELTTSKRGTLNLSHIWTHPGLQGQFRVTARRITTARIYTACSVEDTGLLAWMDSALFLLNNLATSDGLCDNQGLEEPVVPVLPSLCHYPRNR
jgi:hypothetical protein